MSQPANLVTILVFLIALLSAGYAAAQPQTSLAAMPAGLVYPLMGTRVSSSFGNRKHPVRNVTRHHHGVDLAAPRGAIIRAINGGTVVFADPYKGYGKLIVIHHPNGLTSHYGHCDEIRVRTGQRVTPGAIIGTVGSTGVVTGPHLHFEIRKNGIPQNPEALLPNLAADAAG